MQRCASRAQTLVSRHLAQIFYPEPSINRPEVSRELPTAPAQRLACLGGCRPPPQLQAGAQELSVTPGAVGQQVKHLEEVLGLPLFQRLHRSLVLTSHGEALLAGVSDGLERLSAAADAITTDLPQRVLRFGISPFRAGEPDRLLAGLAGTGEPPPICGRP